jgi:rhodanese-related sulfurtransferase
MSVSLLDRFLGTSKAAPAAEVDVAGAHALQQQGAQLIDVREPHEFAVGHAHGARNIPLGSLSDRMREVATDRTVLLICRSGNRSRAAQNLLRRRDLADTRNVRGGMLAWERAGLPIKTK